MDRLEIEDFLYREARLMDEHRYDEWESLWTDDALYWVPCGGDDTDPTRHVSIIYADRAEIARRIKRMKSDAAWAQDPKSRLRRLISNMEIERSNDAEIVVYSNFILVEVRRRGGVSTWEYIWAGRTMHRLRWENGNLRMSYKKVMLVNNDAELPTLWFLL